MSLCAACCHLISGVKMGLQAMSEAATTLALPVWTTDELVLAEDLFIIPDGDRFLAYAPFSPGMASVNATAARLIQQVKDGTTTLAQLDPDFLQSMIDAGVVSHRDSVALRPAFARKDAFDPDGLTLFLTTRCSLGCTYCYASANDRPSLMSWETAKAGLDWLFNHAQARGRDRVDLTFHGGGEVTLALDVLKRAVGYAQAEGAARGIAVHTSAGLNGVMAGPALEWILSNIGSATVSLDGLPDVHNAQRPLVNGRGSFDLVASALKRMDEVGFDYGLRATVTRLGLPSMVDAVDFMCRTFRTKWLHFEPVASSGRAREHDLAPDPLEFVQQFRTAREVARSYGRELKYSGARFGTLTPHFCQASDDLLALTPEGLLSSCYEVGQEDDPRAATFFYGRLDGESGRLDVDMQKLRRLRTLSVEHKPACDTCFCRWSCAGECSAKLALSGDAWSTGENSRCIINRELTLDQMKEWLDSDGVRP